MIARCGVGDAISLNLENMQLYIRMLFGDVHLYSTWRNELFLTVRTLDQFGRCLNGVRTVFSQVRQCLQP